MRDLSWSRALSLMAAGAVQAFLVVVFLCAWDVQAQTEAAPPVDLVLENRKIVTFRATLGSLTPAERASAATARFEFIRVEGAVPPRVDVAEIPGAGKVLSVRGTPIVWILAGDIDTAGGANIDRVSAVSAHMLREALASRWEMRSGSFLLRASLSVAGATVAFVLVLVLIGRITRRLRNYIPDPGDPRFSMFTLAGFHLGPYAVRALERIVIIAGLTIQLLCAYLWLAFCLMQFPLTKPWGEALDQYLIDAGIGIGEAIVGAIPGLAMVAIIFVGTRAFIRVVRAFLHAVEVKRIEITWIPPEMANATRRVVTFLIWIFAISVAYPYIPGADTPAFKGISVFVGLMISIGSSGLVNQVMSGLVVIYSRTCKVGDVIKVGDAEGRVTEVGVLSTKLMTKKRLEITIPNAVLIGNMTTNFSTGRGDAGLILHTSVTIGYDTSWRQVHAMLLLAAERTPDVRRDPRPFVLQTALSDFYVEYQLNAHIDDPDARTAILSALHANIQDVFNEFGVQIMSPNFEAQPDAKVWVPKEKWFEAPASAPPKGGNGGA